MLKAGKSLEKVLVSLSAHGPIIEEIKALCRTTRTRLQPMDSGDFRRKFGEDSQGIIGFGSPFSYASETSIFESVRGQEKVVLIALNGVEDPGNLGAVVRTAEAAGARGLIIPLHRAAGMTEGAIQTAQGAAAHLPVARVPNLGNFLEAAKEDGFWVIGLDSSGRTRLDQVKYPSRVVLVSGGENVGLGPRLLSICDETALIPLTGRTTSLNLSVSTAVCLFEVLRQWGFPSRKS